MGMFDSAPAAKPVLSVSKKVAEEVKSDVKRIKKVGTTVQPIKKAGTKAKWATLTTCTPKMTVVVTSLGSGEESANTKTSTLLTLKQTVGNFQASLAVTDGTVRELKAMRGVLVTADYKINSNVTANSKFDAFSKAITLGSTWDGNLKGKKSQLKFWMNNKDRLACGEAKMVLNKQTSTLFTFNQERLLSAKYTIVNGPWLWEPSYNFVKAMPMVSVTKSSGVDTYKASYELTSEQGVLEYSRKPFKITLATKMSPDFKFAGKPTLTAMIDNVYSF